MLDVIEIIGPVVVDPDPDRGRMIVIGEEGVVIRVAMIEEDRQKGLWSIFLTYSLLIFNFCLSFTVFIDNWIIGLIAYLINFIYLCLCRQC